MQLSQSQVRAPLLATLLFVGLVASPGLAPAQSPEPGGAITTARTASVSALPDHAGHETRIVGISAGALLPTVKQIESGDAFGWLNYSTQIASISFDRSVAAQMTCRGPSPFELQSDRLRAASVASGGYATLCNLAPGEYDYEVELVGKGKVLLGKIVVN